MDNMLQMRWGLLHGLEHGLHLYGDRFLIQLRMWWDVLRNDWWWHEDVHSHGLGVTVGLATQLVQIMRACSVQRCVSICWSIMAAVYMRTTHDEVHMICCRKHVAWDGGTNLPRWEQHVEIVTGWLMVMDWDDFPMYDIPMDYIPWYGYLGDKWLLRQDMMEMVVLHMLQGWL